MRIIWLFMLFVNITAMLTPYQWKNIEKCLQRTDLTPPMRTKINTIIFTHYIPLAYKQCSEFTKLHKFKTNMISRDELRLYSLIGLHHATRNYNGRTNFRKYASIYIRGALYNGLSERFPISKISSRKRRMKQTYSYSDDLFDSVYERPVNQYLGTKSYLPIASNLCTKPFEIDQDRHMRIWDYIDTLEPFHKRIIYSKYNFNLEIIRSNENIALLCGCSEETVRKYVYKTVMNLTRHNIYPRIVSKYE